MATDVSAHFRNLSPFCLWRFHRIRGGVLAVRPFLDCGGRDIVYPLSVKVVKTSRSLRGLAQGPETWTKHPYRHQPQQALANKNKCAQRDEKEASDCG